MVTIIHIILIITITTKVMRLRHGRINAAVPLINQDYHNNETSLLLDVKSLFTDDVKRKCRS